MDIQDRIKKVLKEANKTNKKLEQLTGIDRYRWANIKREKNAIKARTEDLEAICEIFPKYSYWLVTGKELPESGQFSPDHEGMVH